MAQPGRRHAGWPTGEAESAFQRGEDCWSQGKQALAIKALQRSSELYRLAGDEVGSLRALHFLGNVLYETRAYEMSRVMHEHVLQSCLAAELWEGVASSRNNLGLVLARQGFLREGLASLEEGLALYRELKHDQGVEATTRNIEAVLARRAGEPESGP